jgi:Mg/Co/Ni transporter MgtE
MNANLVKVKETAPERKVTRMFIKYTFGAVPVVDNQNKIKGIILFKDAVDKALSAIAEG